MLMAALFALGLMSITWMVVVAAAIAAEKLLPSPTTTNRVIAAGLAALGIAMIGSPGNVPGLVLPDSAQAQRAMQAMHGMKNAPGTRKGTAMPGMQKPDATMPRHSFKHPMSGSAMN